LARFSIETISIKKDHRLMKQATHSTGIGQTGFRIALVIFLLCLLHALWSVSLGWGNTLNDHFSFRQSQNAIMAYYLIKDPFSLHFELPVLGKPWAIPTEFPLYDLVAANVSKTTGLALDQSGRVVCASFYFLILIPVYALLRWRRLPATNALLFLCILLVSPYYLFWARTFMPESSALFFSVSYFACMMCGLESASLILLGCGAIFGAAAGLSKVTTWLPFLGFTGLWIIRDYIYWPLRVPAVSEIRRLVIPMIFGCGVPFIISVWWIRFSDGLKKLNPIGINLSSASAQMSTWNYGTLGQKLSLQVWEIILSRFFTLFGLPLQAWIILICSAAVVIATRRRWREYVVLIALLLISPAVFTNVHFVHDYYMNANGLFLLGAVGFALMGLLESEFTRAKLCGVLYFSFILWSGISGVGVMYHPLQQMPNGEILQLTDYIKKNTPKDSVLIILGADWSPLVSYYSERRTLMIPDWEKLTQEQVLNALKNLKGEKIGTLLICGPSRYSLDVLLKQSENAGLKFPIIKCGPLPLR